MKYIKYFFQFILIKLFFLIFKLVGYKNASNIGGLIGSKIGPIFKSKKIITENLRTAKISHKLTYNKLATNVLGNYGRIFAEYIHLKNFRNDKLKKYISINGYQHLEKIKKSKKTVVFISGHFNNFELMAMQIEKSGIDLAAIYRPLNNPYLNKTMEIIRKKEICRNQIKKGRAGTREIIRNLNNGKSIAIMVDQRVREGKKVPFFETLAATTTIPAQLIKKYNCELVPIYIEREKFNYFKMYISEPIKFKKTKTILEITIFINKILEKMILKNMDQWIWTHNRWKN